MRVRHFGIPVNNINSAKRKFEKLGFKVIYDKVENVRIIKMKLGEHIVELLEFECVHNLKPHVAFTDCDDFYVEVVKDAVDK